MAEKIDCYGQCLQQAQQLRQEIIDLMKQQNFVQHFGTHYKAELETTEKTIFTDHEAVIKFLREQHLLPKVLVPTQRTIENLLTDPTVDSSVKQQLLVWVQKMIQENLHIEKTQ